MPEFGRSVCWIRRDMRLEDHTALAQATARSETVAVVFVYDTIILDAISDRSDRRMTFIHQTLEELSGDLKSLGSEIVTLIGDPVEVIPQFCADWKAEAVFAAHDDDPYALERDKRVRENLSRDGAVFHTFKDHVVFERREVLTGGGEAYKVFTPYSRAWRALLEPHHLDERVPDKGKLAPLNELPEQFRGNRNWDEIGFEENSCIIHPGPKAARKRLEEFLERVSGYGRDRDFPALDSTSGLSMHLRFGTISVRECFRAVHGDEREGAHKWETELIWREFYHMILANFPKVGQGHAFKSELDDLPWTGTEKEFQRWCAGRTGYPIVDAAMRCFNSTGWMHNRLRMIVAMFLTKDLLVDWRKGEQYFAERLLDFDLASNNGGWQWSASTGVDAQPYFRIFNPVLQSAKYDPEGAFIRKWCPELRDLDDNAVHWPFDEDGGRNLETPADYPDPIVIHREQKGKALALFKS